MWRSAFAVCGFRFLTRQYCFAAALCFQSWGVATASGMAKRRAATPWPLPVAAVAEPHAECFRRQWWHIQGAVQTIPYREFEAPVAAQVAWLVTVVKLMVRGADQPAIGVGP